MQIWKMKSPIDDQSECFYVINGELIFSVVSEPDCEKTICLFQGPVSKHEYFFKGMEMTGIPIKLEKITGKAREAISTLPKTHAEVEKWGPSGARYE
jgi:hypothetical protein